jgi:hypothetical protein
MGEPDAFDPDRALLLATKFSPLELKTQALQAVAALIIQHSTVLDHNIYVAEEVTINRDELLNVLDFKADLTNLIAARDLIAAIGPSCGFPPEDMIRHYQAERESKFND